MEHVTRIHPPETIQALATRAGCRDLTRKQTYQSFGLIMNRVPGSGERYDIDAGGGAGECES